jgi:hypothetical protein
MRCHSRIDGYTFTTTHKPGKGESPDQVCDTVCPVPCIVHAIRNLTAFVLILSNRRSLPTWWTRYARKPPKRTAHARTHTDCICCRHDTHDSVHPTATSMCVSAPARDVRQVPARSLTRRVIQLVRAQRVRHRPTNPLYAKRAHDHRPDHGPKC